MSSMLFERMSIVRKLTRLLEWGVGAVAVALTVAGCGGGGNVMPTAAAPSGPDQVAAFARTQQSMAQRVAPADAVALAAASTDAAGDMISNGGFEGGMTGWVNWGNASVVSGQASSGTWALGVGTAAGGAGQEVGGIVPGSSYRLTAQAKVGAASETLYVGVNFLDRSSLPLTQNAVLVTSTAYTTVGFEVVAPPNAVKALVYVWKNGGSGLGFLDEIAFGPAGGAAPALASSGNLVTNAGFESGLANWVDWGNAASTAEAAAGSSAARVGTGAGGFGQRLGVAAGTSYRLSALAKVSTPGEVGYLGVLFTDDAGTGLLVQNVVFRSTAYSTVQADLTVPANATRALVFVWKNDGSGFALVDEVALAGTAGGTPATPPAPPVVGQAAGPEVAVTTSGSFTPLPWGGWVTAKSVGGSRVLQQYGADGQPVGPATAFVAPPDIGSVVPLQGAGAAAVWLSQLGGGVGQVWTQAYGANGVALGSPVPVAQVNPVPPTGPGMTLNPAAVPQLAPLVGGGYAVVWALPQAAGATAHTDLGVYSQRFDAQGRPAGAVQQATMAGAGFLDVVGTTTGGYVVSWGIQAPGSAGGARAYSATGEPLAPAQVAGSSWIPGAGPRGTMTPLAGGGAVLVWQLRAQPVFVQFITGAGIALPAQMASDVAPSSYGLVAAAGLPDGGAAVAWTDLGGRVYARRYAADGTPRGLQTRLNLVTTPSGSAPQLAVMDDGSFTIAWDVGATRYAQTFPADGLVAP